MDDFRIALAGCGTVGGGVWQHLHANADLLRQRTGANLVVRRAVVRRPVRAQELGIPSEMVTADWQPAVTDPEIDIVVELIGGIEQAKALIEAALENGKHVVTANKALLAAHGAELFALAAQNKKQLLFEASVAGGIPFIRALREGLIANRIVALHGIINGTCNYILTRMNDGGLSYPEALKEAKDGGYAEADESLDVEGHDAAHKAAVIGALAYGFWVPEESLHTEGVTNVERQDVVHARQLGYEIKLLAIIKIDDEDAVEVRVHPTMVPVKHVLASVDGVFNAIMVRGDVVGDTLYYGRGAGADPTASAVISDIAEAARRHVDSACWHAPSGTSLTPKLKDIKEITSRYYLRLTVADKPGVLAQVAAVLGAHAIGISSVIQPEIQESRDVPLILMVHDAKEKNFRAALAEISNQEAMRAEPVSYRVEDFEQ